MPRETDNDNVKTVEDLGFSFAYITGNEAYFHCIWHKDSGASFCVSLNNPVWYCHSASHVGKCGGNLFQLRELVDNIPLYEPLPRDSSEKPPEIENQRRIAKISIEDFYKLSSAEDNVHLQKRDFSHEIIKSFDIRRTPLFIVIPVKNYSSDVLGLVIRAILNGWKPKYQYSHGFRKSEYLFGLDKFQEKDTIILVEGALDCIKLHQLGFSNTLAILGSSLSKTQIDILRNLGSRIFLFLDPDDAGKEATRKLARQLSIFDVRVPSYKLYFAGDPAEKNKEEVQRILDNSMSLLKARVEGLV